MLVRGPAPGKGEKVGEDARGPFQVVQGLEERGDRQRGTRQLLEQLDFEDVGQPVGHADDVDAQGLGPDDGRGLGHCDQDGR